LSISAVSGFLGLPRMICTSSLRVSELVETATPAGRIRQGKIDARSKGFNGIPGQETGDPIYA